MGIELRDAIDGLSIDQPGSLLWTHTFKDLPAGYHVRVLKLPAGSYRWRQIRVGDFRIDVSHRHQWIALSVEAGKINYSGDLVYDEHHWQSVYVNRANRTSRILETLDADYPALVEALPFAYHGVSVDPYADFYRAEVPSRPAVTAASPDAAGTPQLHDDTGLLEPVQYSQMRMNPDGTLVAVKVRDLERPGRFDLWVIETASGRAVEVMAASTDYGQHIGSFEWGGLSTLLVTMHPGWTDRLTHIVRLNRENGELTPSFSRFFIRRAGSVIDPLPRDDRHILYARHAHGQLGNVFRLDISDPERIDSQFRSRYRIVKDLDPMLAWLADADGQVRLAMGPGEVPDQWVLRFRETVETPWRAVWTGGIDNVVEPVAFGETPGTVIVLSAAGRDKRAVVELDTATGELGRIIYEDPDVDVSGVITDPGGRGILGIRYYRGGELDVHYLQHQGHVFQESLEKTFPGHSIMLVDITPDRRKALAYVSGPAEPGAYFLFDSEAWSARLITTVSPWLDEVTFRPTELLQVDRPDGLRVEGYLTLPDIEGTAPLVVMPHGGPIGVRDLRVFDPAVQFLARRGYAVLQVNYRGSSGFGKAFEEAGLREWGRAIEDDIEAVMDAVFEQYPVDPDRACIYGSSYGGYSALMSVIRSPHRFRCAASYAGVTDLLLLYDRQLGPQGRANLVEVLGDPGDDRTRLVATSPVYQYDRIERPVFIAHGRLDARVDIEHFFRLEALLSGNGRPVETLVLEGEGHGIADAGNRASYFAKLDAFLGKHLAGEGAANAEAPSRAQGAGDP